MRTITTRKDGYQIFWMNNKLHYYHRYLAEKYIPNKNNYPMVNHIDGNPSNNSIDNLEWTDSLGNMRHAMDNKLWGKNILDKRKLTDKQASEIRQKYVPRKYSTHKLANEYNVSKSTILDIIHNKIYIKKETDYVL